MVIWVTRTLRETDIIEVGLRFQIHHKSDSYYVSIEKGVQDDSDKKDSDLRFLQTAN
jgi:uncharacterized FlaG/YvyC family protein